MNAKKFLYKTLSESEFLDGIKIAAIERPQNFNGNCVTYQQTGIDPEISCCDGQSHTTYFQLDIWSAYGDYDTAEEIAQSILKALSDPIWVIENKIDLREPESGFLHIVIDTKLNKTF